jgi:shikimate dehydrogenase
VLLGHPVAHSLSPTFQNAALARAGLSARYEALDVTPQGLPALLRELIAEGAGGNVTVPHKAAVAAACERRTAIADRVGAVNTFWVEDGQLVGDNTDVGGFDFAVRQLRETLPTHVAVLGAGGAAGAVLAAVSAWPGAQVALWGRTRAHAQALATRFRKEQFQNDGLRVTVDNTIEEALAGADLVVNATPVGLAGAGDADVPVEVDRLPQGADVLDLVYRQGETAWVRAARARGHRAADGLAMVVEQGALAFERWFGFPPDRAAMWAAVVK